MAIGVFAPSTRIKIMTLAAHELTVMARGVEDKDVLKSILEDIHQATQAAEFWRPDYYEMIFNEYPRLGPAVRAAINTWVQFEKARGAEKAA